MSTERQGDNQWDMNQIGAHLQSEREAILDSILGHGARFEVGEQPAQVELYPKARHLDVRTSKLLIGLGKIDLVGSDPNGGLIAQSRDEEGTVTIWLSPDGSLVLHSTRAPSLTELVNARAGEVGKQAENKEKKSKTVVVSGRLKSEVKDGKPDKNGKPTAWARMAVSEEENGDAHLYLATFHKHTTRIALKLSQNDPITVEGYHHPAKEEGRLDTFSVISIHQHLGMSHRKPRR